MLKVLVASVLAGFAVASFGQRPFVIHAPSDIKLPEFQRLLMLAEAEKISPESISESPTGDAFINLKELGVMVVSRNSELMAPVRLARELYALSKKYDAMALIPFSELSDVAQQQFRRNLQNQFPKNDISPNSCFSMQVMFGKFVRAGGYDMSSFYAPSRFGAADAAKKKEDFNNALASKPLALVRKDSEVQDFLLKEALTKEGVYYDQSLPLRSKLEIDRKAMEIFQGWAENEKNKIEDLMYSERASEERWQNILKLRGAKTMDDLKQTSPGQYNDLLDDLRLNWKNYNLKSANQAEDFLGKASVSTGFHFSLVCWIEGSNQRFNFSPSR
jgi:hypothetical protein